ncbi:MAG TPA: hypothetical protein PLZ57_08305 [Pseudobdellovibrionaceae bacterium]|nr:hypothetical protein [Pseudobdellovibrionaceae bacterium]
MSCFSWTSEWARAKGLRTKAMSVTTSTNDEAKSGLDQLMTPHLEPLQEISAPSLFLADQQSAGRGRGDHTWLAQPGQALLISFAFACRRPPQPQLTPRVGLAVYRALKTVWPSLSLALKAPNDLLIVDGDTTRKLGGILVESVSLGADHRLVVGLGLNVLGVPDLKPLPESVGAPAPICLSQAAGGAKHVSEIAWRQFMTSLTEAIVASAARSSDPKLSDEERRSLLSALRLHPGHRQLTEVAPDGSLVEGQARRDWSEL